MESKEALKEHLDGAHKEFCASMSEFCKQIYDGENFSTDQIVKEISNETAKCLHDYKTVICEILEKI